MMASGAAPDPDFVLRVPDQSPVTSLQSGTSLQHGTGDKLLSGHQNGNILVWDLKTRRVVDTVPAHQDTSVLSLEVARNGDVISQGRDGAICRWDAGNAWTKLDSFDSDSLGFCACRLFRIQDDEMLASPAKNKSSVDINSIVKKEKVATLTPSSGEKTCGMCMAIQVVTNSEGFTQILTGYENGSITLWDCATWKELSTLKCHNESVMALDYNVEINKGFSATALDTIVQWEVVDGKELKILGERKITNPGISCLRIRKDGKLFVTGGWDSQARLFGCKRMKPLAVLSYHSGSVQCAHFTEDNTLILGSKDGCISFWSLYK